MEERLQKIMAHAGIASRRKSEEMIEGGMVTVNGRLATLGDKADLDKDDIRVNGKKIRNSETLRYVILNKKRGIVSTVDDPEGRPTVIDALGGVFQERLYPVGRLDIDSDGLLLLTNDGELANHLTHPRYEAEKTYKVLVEGTPSEPGLNYWRKGVILEDGKTGPSVVKVLGTGNGNTTWLRVVMREGKNRQIRRIAEKIGNPVIKLTRTHIGPVPLGDLKPGDFRELSEAEVQQLREEGAEPEPRKKKKK